jgi:hypothetical protein
VSGAAQNREEVERYASCTLLAAQIKYLDLSEKQFFGSVLIYSGSVSSILG